MQAELDAAPSPGNVVALHPAAVARYEETLRNLADALDCPDPAVAAPLRELIEHVTVYGEPGRGGVGLHSIRKAAHQGRSRY